MFGKHEVELVAIYFQILAGRVYVERILLLDGHDCLLPPGAGSV